MPSWSVVLLLLAWLVRLVMLPVVIRRKAHYLGQYDSPESWEKYHRLVAEPLASRNLPPTPDEPRAGQSTMPRRTTPGFLWTSLSRKARKQERERR